ncbi:actin depolymerizing protein, partial [Piedraia hortae CBS 480.64]
MYTLPQDLKTQLRKFRLSTSRESEPRALLLQISKSLTFESEGTYTDLSELAEDLPSNAPRFICVSYPMMKQGRQSVPYVLVSYMPVTCTGEQRMVYAGARELVRAEAGTGGKVIDVEDADE